MPSVYELARRRIIETPMPNATLAVKKPRLMHRTGLSTGKWKGKRVKDLTPQELEDRRKYYREWYELNVERLREKKRKNSAKFRSIHKDEINEKRRTKYHMNKPNSKFYNTENKGKQI